MLRLLKAVALTVVLFLGGTQMQAQQSAGGFGAAIGHVRIGPGAL